MCVDVVARPLLIWLTESAAVCVSAFTLELFTPQSCCTGERGRETQREMSGSKERGRGERGSETQREMSGSKERGRGEKGVKKRGGERGRVTQRETSGSNGRRRRERG